MLIALPPSEGKTAPDSGPKLDFDSLSLPEWNDTRRVIAEDLMEISAQDDALTVLGVGPKIAHEVADQVDLLDLPCAPAHEVYTGVLYQGADFAELSADQLRRASESVLIFSALFGATSPTDLIPRYRLTMKAPLPHGTPAQQLKPLWADLDERADGQLLIDCRSSEYAAWKARTARVVKITAVRDDGLKRKTISHNAKYYRGLITNIALRTEGIDTPEDLAEVAGDIVHGDIKAIELDRGILTVVQSA